MPEPAAAHDTSSSTLITPADKCIDRIERGLYDLERLLRAESRRCTQQIAQLRSALSACSSPDIEHESGSSHNSSSDIASFSAGDVTARKTSISAATAALLCRTQQLQEAAATDVIRAELARLWGQLVQPWYRSAVMEGFERPVQARLDHLSERVSRLARRLRGGSGWRCCDGDPTAVPDGVSMPLAACARTIFPDGEGDGAIILDEEEGEEGSVVHVSKAEKKAAAATVAGRLQQSFLAHPRRPVHVLRMLLQVVPEAMAAIDADMEAPYGCFYRLARTCRGNPQPLPSGVAEETRKNLAADVSSSSCAIDGLLSLCADVYGNGNVDSERNANAEHPSPTVDQSAPLTNAMEHLFRFLYTARARGRELRRLSPGDLTSVGVVSQCHLLVPDPLPVLVAAYHLLGGNGGKERREGASGHDAGSNHAADDDDARTLVQTALSVLAESDTRATLAAAALTNASGCGAIGGKRDGQVLRCLQEKERAWRQRSMEAAMAWWETTTSSGAAQRLSGLPMWSLLRLQEAGVAATTTAVSVSAGEREREEKRRLGPTQVELMAWLREQLHRSPPTSHSVAQQSSLMAAGGARVRPRPSPAASPRDEPTSPSATPPDNSTTSNASSQNYPVWRPQPGLEAKLTELYRTCPLLYVMERL